MLAKANYARYILQREGRVQHVLVPIKLRRKGKKGFQYKKLIREGILDEECFFIKREYSLNKT